MSRERPILFSGPMVRALLDGRKTQTRRAIKPQPAAEGYYSINGAGTHALHLSGAGADMLFIRPTPRSRDHRLPCPYGAPGDRLWVKETWGLSAYFDDTDWLRGSVKGRSQDDIIESWRLHFAADYEGSASSEYPYWRPSIHMPRWASRLTLEVTQVRVERLQDISEEDAIAEGVEQADTGPLRWVRYRNYMSEREAQGIATSFASPRESFFSLWESIHGTESWAANPWVWVVSFRVVRACDAVGLE